MDWFLESAEIKLYWYTVYMPFAIIHRYLQRFVKEAERQRNSKAVSAILVSFLFLGGGGSTKPGHRYGTLKNTIPLEVVMFTLACFLSMYEVVVLSGKHVRAC